jgi:large subunit ribosomal protein L33
MARVQKDSATLVSSGGTNFFYINRKNKKKSKGEKKLKLRKYDPVLRKHVLFEDKKLSRKKKGAAAKQATESAAPAAAADAS